MEPKPTYEELVRKLADVEEIVTALRNQEVDAVVGTRNVLMLRLKDAEDQLRKQREYLEQVVVERTADLRELSHRLVEVQEKERASIGYELHDEIGQHLTYAALLIEKGSKSLDPQLLSQAQASVQAAIAQIRNLSSMLSARLLRSAGLRQSVATMAEEFKRNANINVRFDHNGSLDGVPQDLALAAYRIIQESLTNAARHSHADDVTVRIARESGTLLVEVKDNGIGFDSASTERSTGLTGMRERALAQGGELTIDTNQGRGTRVVARLPLSGQDEGK